MMALNAEKNYTSKDQVSKLKRLYRITPIQVIKGILAIANPVKVSCSLIPSCALLPSFILSYFNVSPKLRFLVNYNCTNCFPIPFHLQLVCE